MAGEEAKKDRKASTEGESQRRKQRSKEQKRIEKLEAQEMSKISYRLENASEVAVKSSKKRSKKTSSKPQVGSNFHSTAEANPSVKSADISKDPEILFTDLQVHKSSISTTCHLLQTPLEVLDNILSYLDQQHWLSLTKLNSTLAKYTERHLYKSPRLSSSYSIAQFAWLVSNKAEYGLLVRELNLNYDTDRECFDSNRSDPTSHLRCPTWQDFKFRNHELYGPVYDVPGAAFNPCGNYLLDVAKNVPCGIVLQLLIACPNLRKLDLSDTRPDWEIIAVSKSETIHPVTGKLFISEVPRSARPRNTADEPVTGRAIIRQVRRMKHLEVLRLRRNITVKILRKILESCTTLKEGHFQSEDSKICGDRNTLEAALGLRPRKWKHISKCQALQEECWTAAEW